MQATASFACLDGTNCLDGHEIRIPTESTQRGHDITIRNFNYYYYITKTRRSEITAHSSTSTCAYPHINMRTYVVGVFVQARII